jgi:hypothetical protein
VGIRIWVSHFFSFFVLVGVVFVFSFFSVLSLAAAVIMIPCQRQTEKGEAIDLGIDRIQNGRHLFLFLFYSILLRFSLRYVTLRYVTLRFVTLRFVSLRYVTLRSFFEGCVVFNSESYTIQYVLRNLSLSLLLMYGILRSEFVCILNMCEWISQSYRHEYRRKSIVGKTGLS